MPKKRNIPENLLSEITNKYLNDRKSYNLAKLSEQYNIPYSTLRRYLLAHLKAEDLENALIEDTLPYEGFEFLKIGDTYQWDRGLTIWKVEGIKRMDGEKIFVIVPCDYRAKNHYICEDFIEADQPI